ncbi:DNA polymerase III subunit chi [Candidatus Erwinia haradaeae]|uniref:DNA polymerase III subunit chi n=1 Tax=Candidatus Erwinia haradaeae TaxID=1922217 RepID=A0A803FUF6_9GAMM|nr:DNA polymerase III subunit chi [Candidatus Erwinia haradaeae]VFP88771.1 DNA polymerase III subunit chi [Candidatus Erwinia haradaeae]
MTHVTFYLLQPINLFQDINYQEQLICFLAYTNWKKRKRMLILCQNKEEAITIDEALWNQPIYSFIPHNLTKQGPSYGAPIEITWPNQRFTGSRTLLMNLGPHLINSFSEFSEIIDFVPFEQPLKQLARDRYTQYRNLGYQLSIIQSK